MEGVTDRGPKSVSIFLSKKRETAKGGRRASENNTSTETARDPSSGYINILFSL
jgi:hypothetical protein